MKRKPWNLASDIIASFFPFHLCEQALVAHKFFLETAANLRKDIDLRAEVKRHMGHCILSLKDDGKICVHIVQRIRRIIRSETLAP